VKIALLLFSVLLPVTLASAQVGHPRPPGLAQADQAESQADKTTPPPQQRAAPSVDPAKLQRDADELSKLAQSIPLDISKVTQGILPKDVIEKLKQIEKLSKRLRSELAP
jgi:hypothetical protein